MVFNSHDSRYIPCQEWLERNIINVDEDIIVHDLTLCYEIWCARNKKCFEGTDVDVTALPLSKDTKIYCKFSEC